MVGEENPNRLISQNRPGQHSGQHRDGIKGAGTTSPTEEKLEAHRREIALMRDSMILQLPSIVQRLDRLERAVIDLLEKEERRSPKG